MYIMLSIKLKTQTPRQLGYLKCATGY